MILQIVSNALLVIVVSTVGARSESNAAHITTFFMVFTVGLAFAILYRFDVPARESLGLLWGNIFALAPGDALLTTAFALLVLVALLLLFPYVRAVLYDRETAFTSGIDDRVVYVAVLFVVGLTITLVMGLIGALLLDAILVLPALIAGFYSRSTRELFVRASVFGLGISVVGFGAAIRIDIPVSSGITLVGALTLGITALHSRIRKE